MKKTLPLKFEFDIPTIRRSLAVITGESFTDEEIEEKFINIETVVLDTEKEMEGEAFSMALAFTATIIGHTDPELMVKKK